MNILIERYPLYWNAPPLDDERRMKRPLGLKYGGKTHTHSSVVVSTTFPFHEHLPHLSDVSYCWSRRGPFSLLRLKDFWRASLYPGVEDLGAAADDASAQLRRLSRCRMIASDAGRCREFLLSSSMISTLREAEAIE